MHDVIEQHRTGEWGIEELIAAARKLLRRGRVEAEDGRVAAVLDTRTIRYYQTLGLLDKPQRFEGRRAVYGFRHLLQLICIRQLQAEGHPLALIQQSLAGLPTAELESSIRQLLAVPQPEAPVRTEQRGMIAAEVAPGVSVMIDPEKVRNPQAILDRIGGLFGAARRTPHDSARE